MKNSKGKWNSLKVPGGESETPKTESEILEAVSSLDAPVTQSDEDIEAELDTYRFTRNDEQEDEVEETSGADDESDEGSTEGDSGEADTTNEPKVADQEPKKSRFEKRIHQFIEKVKAKDEQIAKLKAQSYREREELEARLQEYEAALASTVGTSAEEKIKAAKEKLRKAKMEADTELEIEATADLQEAFSYKNRADELKANLPAKRETKQFRDEDTLASHKVTAWGEVNRSIVQSPVLMGIVTKIDAQIRKEGFEPHTDEYFEEANKRMNTAFKAAGFAVKAKSIYSFDDDDEDTEEEEVVAKVQKEEPKAQKKVNPMAVGPRTGNQVAKKQIGKVTPQEQAFANRLGVPADVLFKQSKLNEAKNKFGYAPVYIPKKTK